jgi:hypothetical protein
MKNSKLTPEQKKANKAASDKAYRERKKAEAIVARPAEVAELEAPEVMEAPVEAPAEIEIPVIEAVSAPAPKVEKAPKEVVEVIAVVRTFEVPVRLFWNRRFEEKNSSCAKPGTELSFEAIGEGEYRVRRGKRNFFANDANLAIAGVSLS